MESDNGKLIKAGGRIHYGWYIVFAGSLCIFAGLGFGRFALGMLLPAMASSLHLSYSQMGYISTANFAGYLVAVLLAGYCIGRIGARRLIFYALLLVGISMLLVGCAGSFTVVLSCYTLTGIGSGLSNVPMMALVSSWFTSKLRGRAAGFIVIGSGYAILLTGKLVPYLNTVWTADGWRLNWLVLGGAVILIAFICLAVLRDTPYEIGLTPVGSHPPGAMVDDIHIVTKDNTFSRKDIYHLGAIYFIFGCTYVIYATFIVTYFVRERGLTEAGAGNLWSMVGLLSLLSGPVFGTLSDKFGRRAGLIVVFVFQAAAYLLVAVKLPEQCLYLSIGCYGVVAWSIPSIMAALAGDLAGPKRAASVFGFITFIFAWGQIIGPAVAGYLAEVTGTFASSFLLAAATVIVGILLTCRLRKFTSH